MYHKPKVERFGTVRELTLVGFTGATDGYTITGGSTTGNGSDLCGGATSSPCPTSS